MPSLCWPHSLPRGGSDTRSFPSIIASPVRLSPLTVSLAPTRTPAAATRTRRQQLDPRDRPCDREANSGRVAGSYPTRSRRGSNHSPAEGHRAACPAAGSGRRVSAPRRPVPGDRRCLGLFARYARGSCRRGQPHPPRPALFSPAPAAAARNGTSRGGDCGRRTLEGWG